MQEDNFTELVLDEIEEQTPEDSIQREYAEATIDGHSPFDPVTPYDVAVDMHVRPVDENVSMVASHIIDRQLRWFRDLNSGEHNNGETTVRDELRHYEIDFDGSTPEVNYGVA